MDNHPPCTRTPSFSFFIFSVHGLPALRCINALGSSYFKIFLLNWKASPVLTTPKVVFQRLLEGLTPKSLTFHVSVLDSPISYVSTTSPFLSYTENPTRVTYPSRLTGLPRRTTPFQKDSNLTGTSCLGHLSLFDY